MMYQWSEVLASLVAGQDLDPDAAYWAMSEILGGKATNAQIAGFVVGLRSKGETVTELRSVVDALYERALPLPIDQRVVDIVGTGGDMAKTVNISSMSAVTIAGAGVPVVKHGNRASSSQTGTADVFERLGLRLDLDAQQVQAVFDHVGVTFCFAQVFHPAMRHVVPTRKELAIPTVFNFMGPLANPAHPAAMALGCSDLRMAPLMAGVLAERGVEALVFRGDDGLDEITICSTTQVWQTSGSDVVHRVIDPRQFGFQLAGADALRGGDADFNADVFNRVIDGEHSPVRDAVLLNAGAAIAVFAEQNVPWDERYAAGIDSARQAIDSGSARRVLDEWASTTQQQSTS